MSTATITQPNALFEKILSNLTEKEQNVLVRRIGLKGERETLQEIGDDYDITRERVRQIEDVGIRKLGRLVRTTDLLRIQEAAEEILKLHGGMCTRDRLVSAIVRTLSLEGNVHLGVVETIVQASFHILKSKPQLGTHTYFFLPEVNKKSIQEIAKEASKILKKRGDIIDQKSLYEMIRINLSAKFGKIDDLLIDSVIDAFMEFVKGEEVYVGLAEWKILNPTTLKDKAIYILKKEKAPMHFVELSNAISTHFKEPVKVATIHNELIRNNEFVLIGRGIYVLKAWGYKPGTVLDVIIDVLEKNKGPMKTQDILNKVLKVRKVKTSTIYMNLQNKKIIGRVGRNLYDLKNRTKNG